jgi:hypothetical protein
MPKRPEMQDPAKRMPRRQPDEPEAARKAADDDLDPREEEGWSQPESSAQKGSSASEPE